MEVHINFSHTFHLFSIFQVIKAQKLDSQSDIEDSTFPQQMDLINFTKALPPAHIIIPATVVMERLYSSEGIHDTRITEVSII